MSTIPYRHAPGGRTRIDARIVDRVVLALERHMRLRPQRLHHLHLLFRPPAAVMEILVEADELDLVPADADAKAEACRRTARPGTPPASPPARSAAVAGSARRWRSPASACTRRDSRTARTDRGTDRRCRCGPIPAGRDAGIDAQHMIGRFEEIVAHPFHLLRIVAYRNGSPPISPSGTSVPICMRILLIEFRRPPPP